MSNNTREAKTQPRVIETTFSSAETSVVAAIERLDPYPWEALFENRSELVLTSKHSNVRLEPGTPSENTIVKMQRVDTQRHNEKDFYLFCTSVDKTAEKASVNRTAIRIRTVSGQIESVFVATAARQGESKEIMQNRRIDRLDFPFAVKLASGEQSIAQILELTTVLLNDASANSATGIISHSGQETTEKLTKVVAEIVDQSRADKRDFPTMVGSYLEAARIWQDEFRQEPLPWPKPESLIAVREIPLTPQLRVEVKDQAVVTQQDDPLYEFSHEYEEKVREEFLTQLLKETSIWAFLDKVRERLKDKSLTKMIEPHEQRLREKSWALADYEAFGLIGRFFGERRYGSRQKIDGQIAVLNFAKTLAQIYDRFGPLLIFPRLGASVPPLADDREYWHGRQADLGFEITRGQRVDIELKLDYDFLGLGSQDGNQNCYGSLSLEIDNNFTAVSITGWGVKNGQAREVNLTTTDSEKLADALEIIRPIRSLLTVTDDREGRLGGGSLSGFEQLVAALEKMDLDQRNHPYIPTSFQRERTRTGKRFFWAGSWPNDLVQKVIYQQAEELRKQWVNQFADKKMVEWRKERAVKIEAKRQRAKQIEQIAMATQTDVAATVFALSRFDMRGTRSLARTIRPAYTVDSTLAELMMPTIPFMTVSKEEQDPLRYCAHTDIVGGIPSRQLLVVEETEKGFEQSPLRPMFILPGVQRGEAPHQVGIELHRGIPKIVYEKRILVPDKETMVPLTVRNETSDNLLVCQRAGEAHAPFEFYLVPAEQITEQVGAGGKKYRMISMSGGESLACMPLVATIAFPGYFDPTFSHIDKWSIKLLKYVLESHKTDYRKADVSKRPLLLDNSLGPIHFVVAKDEKVIEAQLLYPDLSYPRVLFTQRLKSPEFSQI